MATSRGQALSLVGVAAACALVALIATRLVAEPNPWVVSASAAVGAVAAWRAMKAARESGSMRLRLAAAGLFGFLGVVLLLAVGVAVMVLFRRASSM